MSKYIAFKEHDGTPQRAVALVLDHHLIFSGDGRFVLRDPRRGLDGVTDAILGALAAAGPVQQPTTKERTQ